eukprot:scaffold4368_cov348-Prasinococcus_capsulatus_cf.AAC.5
MSNLEVAPTDEKLASCSHEWVHKSYQCTSYAENEKVYDEWAKVYDSTMDPDHYQAPIGLVNHLKKNSLVDVEASVVDIGCGTGLLGKYMVELGGFKNLDGIDQSQGMLDEAGKKGIYKQLVKGTLGLDLPLPDNTYDAAVSSGVFTPGHAPAKSLYDVAKLIKPGGIVCYTLKYDLYENSDYPAVHKDMEEKGIWECAGHSEKYDALPGDKVRQTALGDR